jgi:TolA-binding protein
MDAAVFDREYRWPTGAKLKVGFLDGSRIAREAVALTADAWTQYANVDFEFSLDAPPKEADILIRFDAEGCTSHVGTSSRYYTEIGEPSMHLCRIDQWVSGAFDPAAGVSSLPEGFREVVLHEFGHALGLQHEHQSPRAEFQWNKEVVYDFYGTSYGWDRDYVDMWVFRQIDPQLVDASQYDPDSIMHYSFPAQFTTNGVAFRGSHELSVIDKEHIAKEYPRKTDAKVRRRFERKIAVRNETALPLDVQVVHEIRKDKKLTWVPTSEPATADGVRVPAGAESMLDGQGRRVKVVARSADGRSTWSEWAAEPLRIAPKGGYLDVDLQTYVIVIDGPPDAPVGQTLDELYGAASKALTAGDYEGARALFGDLVERFPSDALVPWARFNIVLSWYQQQRWEEALQASYELVVDHPRADATIYAWYYGGVSALQLGWCDGARGYLEYVESEEAGAPDEWRSAAREYLQAVEKDPARWCW